MASCSLPLVLLAALLGMVACSPIQHRFVGSRGGSRGGSSSSPRVSSPLDLLDDRTRSLPPDMADPYPIPKHSLTKKHKQPSPKAVGDDSYRLGTNIRPILYQLEITPDLTKFTFKGEVLMVINVLEKTDTIVMHSKELTMSASSIQIADDDTQYIYTTVSSITFDKERDFLTIKLKKALQKGGRYMVDIPFTGILNDDLEGFYRSSYTSGGETRWLATTQFESTGARRAFPCFDEPSFKARFYIFITRDKSLTALSNMPKLESDPSGGKVTDSFDSTLPMSTYLLAFIVSDFSSLSNTKKNFTTWARKDIIKGGQFSQDIGQKALSLLAEFLDIPYSLPKEDQAAIPDFQAGAMENWGLVTYREEYLIEQDTQTIRIAEYMMTCICHELGHQWTGDLVTLDWWSHTWLNEGWADYLENYICDKIKPEWHLRDKAVVSDHHRAMEYDAEETQWAMSSQVYTPEEDSSKFDRISYSKGGAVIRMWENFLGVDVLRKGASRYLNINMFKNTNPEHLFHAIDYEARQANVLPSGASFPDIARTWTEQPGVPVVTATRDYSSPYLSLSQERFFYSPPNRASLVNQRWYIPVTVVEQQSPDWANLKPTVWLHPKTISYQHVVKASSSQWVLVNPKEIGYYRVNYDVQNWKLLTTALTNSPSQFPGSTRAQLVNDALALARAGKLDYSVALPLFNFLKQERDVAPWQAGVTSLVFLRQKLAGTDAFPNFLSFMNKLTEAAYKFTGYSGSSDHETRYLRYYIASYACNAGNKDCISSANNLLKDWLAGKTTKLDADTQAATWCYGLRGSDAASNFAGLKKKWLDAKDGSARSDLMQALMCVQDESLLNGLLSDAINSKLNITQNEVVNMWKALLNRPEQTEILFKFATNNYKQIDSYFGSSSGDSAVTKLLSNCIETINSPEKLTEARWWVEDNYKGAAGYNTLQSAFLDAYVNMDWYRKYYSTVASWLRTAA